MNGYFEYRKSKVKCGTCKWRGMGHETKKWMEDLDFYGHGCPRCSARLGSNPVPTLAEARANIDQLTEAEREQLGQAEEAHRAHQQVILKTPEQLPELVGDRLTLRWGHEGGERKDHTLIIRHGAREVWREPIYFECYQRFARILDILRQVYGSRLFDLVPEKAAELYLYGDSLGAKVQVDGWRAQLREAHEAARNEAPPSKQLSVVLSLELQRTQRSRYLQVLVDLDARLDETGEALMDGAVNLAMAGPWKEWDQDQAAGTQVPVNLQALHETSDPRVTALARLLTQIAEVQYLLKKEGVSCG